MPYEWHPPAEETQRLLDMMSGSSRGDALVEACLASESGRIYVMLAEVAGRIPPQ